MKLNSILVILLLTLPISASAKKNIIDNYPRFTEENEFIEIQVDNEDKYIQLHRFINIRYENCKIAETHQKRIKNKPISKITVLCDIKEVSAPMRLINTFYSPTEKTVCLYTKPKIVFMPNTTSED